MNYWKAYCTEHWYPGLWQRWFRNQCVAVGWPPGDGWTLTGGPAHDGWGAARNALREMSKGDWVVAQLGGNKVGRIGEVVRKQIAEAVWDPLVPRSKSLPDGDMGRRIIVRWDLSTGPTEPDTVVRLPKRAQLPAGVAMGTARWLKASEFKAMKFAMNDEANWVSLHQKFRYERSLSDYIGTFPDRLEDGLQPYPSMKVRERVFRDRSRLDVLLIDGKERSVVVECKQHDLTVGDVKQIRRYMKNLHRETGKKPRGILVHGGARKLLRDVRRAVNQKPQIEVVQYSLRVDFAPCE
jgi:Endonuclease NucS C-terminal domain